MDRAKILLIKMRYIGDVVLTTPLLEAMRAALPNATFDFLVNKPTAQILADQPHINFVHCFDKSKPTTATLRLIGALRREHYDLVVDLTNNDRSMLFTRLSGAPIRIGFRNKHRLLIRKAYTQVISSNFGRIHTIDHHLKVAEALGLSAVTRHPSLRVNGRSIEKVRQILSHYKVDVGKGYVVIHHGARRWYKSWPSERFAIIADLVTEIYGFPVVLIGGEEDRDSAQKILMKMKHRGVNLAGKIPLRDLPALLKMAICLVGNDSAPIHVATAVNTPVIALFGPTDARAWGPRRSHDIVISVNFPCKPCGHKNINCPLGKNYCMSTIEVGKVWDGVKTIIEQVSMAGRLAK